MAAISNFLFGSPDEFKQLPTKSPAQMGIMNKLTGALSQQQTPSFLGQTPGYQAGMNYLQNLYGQSPEAFERMKAPYMRQFKEETAPMLKEQFAGMGSGGALSSGGFNQALAHAGAGLSERLASQMEGLRSQLLPQLLGYSEAPMNQYSQMIMQMLGINPFENAYQPGSTGLVGGALTGLAGGLGQGAGMAGGAAGMMKLLPLLGLV